MKQTFRTFILLATATMMVASCSRNLSSSTYTSSNPVGKVVYGTVISARQVTVKDTDRLQDNTVGGLAGGVAGGVAGSTIGKGSGNAVATVGGAIAGAVLGAVIQDQLGTSSGTEYIVQLDSAQKVASNVSKKEYRMGKTDSVKSDINQSIQMADTQSQALAVVQQDEVVIAPGTRVVVVYSDDRPRIVPLNH